MRATTKQPTNQPNPTTMKFGLGEKNEREEMKSEYFLWE